jgi:hypothetical protein
MMVSKSKMSDLTSDEQHLLERLGSAGQAIPLQSGDVAAAKSLEKADLVFLVPDGSGKAVITPRGRRLLAELEVSKKVKRVKPPSSF